MFIVWRLELAACRLVHGSWRLGACSLEPLIRIRGPCLAHPLLMIFKSSAMVESCGPDAWLTSIVNFFIFPFNVSAGPGSMEYIAVSSAPEPVNDLTNLSSGKSLNELRLYPIISGTGCQGLELVACSFFLS